MSIWKRFANAKRLSLINTVNNFMVSQNKTNIVKYKRVLQKNPNDISAIKELIYNGEKLEITELINETNAKAIDKENLFKFNEEVKQLFDERTYRRNFFLFGFFCCVGGVLIKYFIDNDLDSMYISRLRISSILVNPGYTLAQKDLKERFTDLKGCDEAIEELKEITHFLNNPEKYEEIGIEASKGILLTGPPGVGKTLLARALAGETACSFFYTSGSSFDEMIVGIGAKRIRDLFAKAREQSPSIIFVDEIDSIGGKRKSEDASVYRQALNQLLTEMDGFNKSDKVVVLAATNMENLIDPALKRPGRFDKIINISAPDIKARKQLFELYLKKIKVSKDIQLDSFVTRAIGFTGADISNLVNMAALRACSLNKKEVDMEDMDYAYDRSLMGVRRNMKDITYLQQEKDQVAVKEIGETFAALLQNKKLGVYKVTLLPTGDLMGHTAIVPAEEQSSQTKKDILDVIDVNMAGRIAEEVFLGKEKISSNSANKLKKATDIAYKYIRDMGMIDDFAIFSANKQELSDKFNYEIEKKVEQILNERADNLRKIFTKNQSLFREMVQLLISKETLESSDLEGFKQRILN